MWFALDDFDGAVERSRAEGFEVVMDVHVLVVAEAHGSRAC